MSKEISKIDYEGKFIVKDGKYYGYPDTMERTYDNKEPDREWLDDPSKAIFWGSHLVDVNVVYIPEEMSMEGAELINVTKTIIIKFSDE